MAKPPIMKAAELPADRKARLYALLTDLSESGRKMAAEKAKNDTAREALVKEFFPNLAEGTSNAVLEFGKKLVMKQPIYRKADADALDALIAEQTVPASLINDVIKYTPEVKVTEWKALSAEDRLKLADVITESRGAVNFAIEDIKS